MGRSCNCITGTPGELFDDNNSDYAGDFSWGDKDVDVGHLSDDRLLSARAPSLDIEVDNNWDSFMVALNPMSPENFTAKVHCILYLYFRYMPNIPIPQFQHPVLESETNMWRFV